MVRKWKTHHYRDPRARSDLEQRRRRRRRLQQQQPRCSPGRESFWACVYESVCHPCASPGVDWHRAAWSRGRTRCRPGRRRCCASTGSSSSCRSSCRRVRVASSPSEIRRSVPQLLTRIVDIQFFRDFLKNLVESLINPLGRWNFSKLKSFFLGKIGDNLRCDIYAYD